MASCDPIESPSGRACDVIRNRFRSLIASQIRASAVSPFAGVIFPRGILRAVGLGLQIPKDLFNPIGSCDRVVVEELELRHPPETEPLAELSSKERRGAPKRARTFTLRLFVTHGRVVDLRELEVGRHSH